MKKGLILFSMMMALAVSMNAQDIKMSEVKEINFYGVDFSLATAPDVKETPAQFKSGIVRINDLLYREVKKYDFQKYLNKTILVYNFAVTDSNNSNIDANVLTARIVQKEISEADIRQIIAPLSTENEATVGFVIIAEVLSKVKQSGTFHVVFFDEATKEIVYSRKVTGNAGGFGVRNYWAASIANILKRWNWK
jgi:hypothetical protein